MKIHYQVSQRSGAKCLDVLISFICSLITLDGVCCVCLSLIVNTHTLWIVWRGGVHVKKDKAYSKVEMKVVKERILIKEIKTWTQEKDKER